MDINAFTKLVQALAWPVVALVAVIILGPGGLLKQLFQMLAESVLGLNRAVADFKDVTATMKIEMARFSELSETMATGFAKKVDNLKAGIEGTSAQLDNLFEKAERLGVSTSAILQELVAREFDLGRLPDQRGPEAEDVAEVSIPASADARYDAIRDEWERFVGQLRTAVDRNDLFDARQIGRMAALMVDGRRKHRLTEGQAQEIADLHSRFKSFARLYQTREEWLSPEVYRDFLSQIRAAERPLRA